MAAPFSRAPVSYAVLRVYDSGVEEVILACRSWYHADEEAGKMRDAMTDGECGLDYNYLPGPWRPSST